MIRDGLLPSLMFGVLLLLVFTGYPVAFSIGGTGLIFAVIGIWLGYFDTNLLYALPDRIFGIMSNYVLLAIVFFIFMGLVLERSRLAEDLLESIGRIFGALPGGLAFGVIAVGGLLAAATGVVGASVVAMGLISLPTMLKYRYAKPLATGVICAAGTLGQIIPPSIVLIVLGDQLGVSIGDLFLGAVLPGFLLLGLYALYIVGVAVFSPESAPPMPEDARFFKISDLAKNLGSSLLPPLLLIVLVLGSIFSGIATATEAGALGSAGAVLLALVKGTLSRRVLRESADHTMRLTSMVIFLLIGSTLFALIFRGLYGDVWIKDVMTALPGGLLGALIAVNVLIFVLGFFIDFFEICFIVIPILAPVLSGMGIDLVWLGVLIGLNLQTSFLTPPFGPALFYLRGVADREVKTTEIYRGVAPFIAIQILTFVLVFIFPELCFPHLLWEKFIS